MKKVFFVSLVIILLGVTFVSATNYDKNLSNRLKGRLLLATEDKGRIWYVSPTDLKRYEITFGNALPLFEKLALGISNKDLEAISEVKSTVTGNRLKGKLLLAVEDKGRIWYIDQNGIKHEVTWGNLMSLFRRLALGITNGNLEKIEKNLEKDSVVQTLQNLSAKFGVYNPQINNNITFEYRFTDSDITSITGKGIKLNQVIINKSGNDLVGGIFNSFGLKENEYNSADGVGTVRGFNNSEIACWIYETNFLQTGSADLEIKCGLITEPFTYKKNNELFDGVIKKEFKILEEFTADELHINRCDANKTKEYFQNVLSRYGNEDMGTEYIFEYNGITQSPGVWVVRVIPNKFDYKNMDDFQRDFGVCSAGEEKYPLLFSGKYLLFASSCGTGFDDGSGRPLGCDLIKEFVQPTIQVQ